MKKTIVMCFLIFSGLLQADEKVTNFEAVGNLESKHDVGCIKYIEAKNIYTPADLFKSSAACANQNNVKDAARLFLLARIYGSYDIKRVSDSSAHQGIMVLVQNTFADMGENANSVEQEINENLIGKDKEFSEFCRVVKSIGKPNYHPQYMISHGMGAFTDSKGNGLVENFNEDQAWLETLSHCG
ncbi:hypothetical protein V6D52_14175 [Idiomarina loihiensis]|jgi:hypothetical protein|uniref:hypothetical protein n=1 Tax=Idiomarina TaxID=135575 RepID=UPI000C111A6E|nr:hypothetical protein [Idiomarina sp.]PHQ88747.1 MAG: hypothetical protein COB44_09700 [Idiomarina sp.]